MAESADKDANGGGLACPFGPSRPKHSPRERERDRPRTAQPSSSARVSRDCAAVAPISTVAGDPPAATAMPWLLLDLPISTTAAFSLESVSTATRLLAEAGLGTGTRCPFLFLVPSNPSSLLARKCLVDVFVEHVEEDCDEFLVVVIELVSLFYTVGTARHA